MTRSNGSGLHIAGRAHLFTESRGCICGSLIVASSPDARELRNLVAQWAGLHPEGRALHGAMHERCTVDEAKARQKAKGDSIEVEKSRIELR